MTKNKVDLKHVLFERSRKHEE